MGSLLGAFINPVRQKVLPNKEGKKLFKARLHKKREPIRAVRKVKLQKKFQYGWPSI